MHLFSTEYIVCNANSLLLKFFKKCFENPFAGRIGGLCGLELARGPEFEHPCFRVTAEVTVTIICDISWNSVAQFNLLLISCLSWNFEIAACSCFVTLLVKFIKFMKYKGTANNQLKRRKLIAKLFWFMKTQKPFSDKQQISSKRARIQIWAQNFSYWFYEVNFHNVALNYSY